MSFYPIGVKTLQPIKPSFRVKDTIKTPPLNVSKYDGFYNHMDNQFTFLHQICHLLIPSLQMVKTQPKCHFQVKNVISTQCTKNDTNLKSDVLLEEQENVVSFSDKNPPSFSLNPTHHGGQNVPLLFVINFQKICRGYGLRIF